MHSSIVWEGNEQQYVEPDELYAPEFYRYPSDTPKFWLDVYAVNCDIFMYRFVSRGL